MSDPVDDGPDVTAAIDTPADVIIETSAGDIGVQFVAGSAPLTVENFLNYVDSGFYDGTIFHRVIANFMIQGGGFTESFERKETLNPVMNEADQTPRNTRYTIAMARTSDPQSATAQFFINVADNAFLDHTAPTAAGWGYAVFAEVVSGADVVDQIAASETAAGGPFASDVPTTVIVINSIRRQQ